MPVCIMRIVYPGCFMRYLLTDVFIFSKVRVFEIETLFGWLGCLLEGALMFMNLPEILFILFVGLLAAKYLGLLDRFTSSLKKPGNFDI